MDKLIELAGTEVHCYRSTKVLVVFLVVSGDSRPLVSTGTYNDLHIPTHRHPHLHIIKNNTNKSFKIVY